MSFSSKTKDELSVLRLKDDAVRLAALAALTHTAGSIMLGRRGLAVEYVTENQNVGQLIVLQAFSCGSVAFPQGARAVESQEHRGNPDWKWLHRTPAKKRLFACGRCG